MESIGNHKPWEVPDEYLKHICFNEKIENRKSIAKRFGLPILKLEPNNNEASLIHPTPFTVYVLSSFEEHWWFKVLESTPNTWILGPTSAVELSLDPSLKIRTKPMFCTSMYGLCFFINCPDNIPLMERMVKLIKWMGGLFVKETTCQMTHMIANSTFARGYTYCITFDVPIMSPLWVEDCWKNRHTPEFKAVSNMRGFELSAFADLYICFQGFESAEEYEKVKALTEKNGGKVVLLDDFNCTHVVFHNDIASDLNISNIPPKICYLVNEDWFWISVEKGHRNYEEYYRCFSLCSIMKSKLSEEICTHNISLQDIEEDGSDIDSQSFSFAETQNIDDSVLQLKLIFQELCQTEENYLMHLWDLSNYNALANKEGEAILNKTEAKIIFGNVNKIISIHEKLGWKLKNAFLSCDSGANVGNIFVEMEDEMIKEYVAFAKNVKVSQETLVQCEKDNYRFKELIEKQTKECNMKHPKDLLIRPVQRLCSIYLLLCEMKKHTRTEYRGRESLEKACSIVQRILNMMNESKAKLEKFTHIFDIHNVIENCPPNLINSHRELIAQFSAQEITDKHNTLGVLLVFFIFNDVMEITKLRSRYHAILNSSGNVDSSIEFKPYKHVAMLPYYMVSNILRFEEDEDAHGLFGFNVHDITNEKKKVIYCFQYLDEDGNLDHVLATIAKQLALRDKTKTADEYILEEVPARRLSIQPIYHSDDRTELSIAATTVKRTFKFVNNVFGR